MIPYILLMFVPLLFSFVTFYDVTNGKRSLIIGGRREILNHSCLIPVFFSLFIVLLVLRDESIGRDLINYKYYFERYMSFDLREVVAENDIDFLYWGLTWVVGRFTDNFQILIAIVAVMTVAPIAII